jgi:hypothetical protein
VSEGRSLVLIGALMNDEGENIRIRKTKKYSTLFLKGGTPKEKKKK